MVNYACAFSQSESGKYFEWIINNECRQGLSKIGNGQRNFPSYFVHSLYLKWNYPLWHLFDFLLIEALFDKAKKKDVFEQIRFSLVL